MKVKIFYSWQNQTDKKYNRNFIEEALKNAIKELSKDKRFQFNEFILDRDTKNIPGSPSIPNTIEDKIKECQIFIGDLTVVNATQKEEKKSFLANLFHKRKESEQDVRLTQNGSVLIEYGIALSKLSTERMVFVMNEHYAPAIVENFPFDIQQKRWPIRYNLSEENIVQRKDILTALSKELVIRLSSILEYGLNNPIYECFPFLDWDKWGHELQSFLPFYPTEKLKVHMTSVQQISNIPKSILRVVGLSGLGKTRLVYESFNPVNAANKEAYKNVLYVDLNKTGNDYIDVIQRLSESNEKRVLILDNCSANTHHNIMSLIKKENSQLSLVSIDYNPITSVLDRSSEFQLIELQQSDYEEVIDDILLNFFPKENERAERELIKKFAKGHTQIAVILAQSKKESTQNWLPIINKPDLLNKLLGADGIDPEKRKILNAISLFEKLGYYKELSYQAELVSKCQTITRLNTSDDSSFQKFKDVTKIFLSRGLIEVQGRYIRIRTKPLAISLAVEWWQACDADLAKKVFEALKEHGELKELLCDQLKYLDFLDEAREIIKDFCSVKGPFGNAEVLNTDEGSRLFRSFVEVNPQACLETLIRVFGYMTKEQLLLIYEGRRNLVWTLEKLCFREETFENATHLLMKFAIAENETHISNNSRGQFFQLFQVYLSGTQASLDERIKIIEHALSQKDKDYDDLAIGALTRSLKTRDFSRMSGPEIQGSSAPLRDHHPPFQKVREYWSFAINKLYEIGSLKEEYYDATRRTIINSTRLFFNARSGDLIIPFIKKIILEDQRFWFEIRDQIKFTLKYEADLLPNEKEDLQILSASLETTDFEFLYKRYVKRSSWEDVDEVKDYNQLIDERLSELASRFVEEKLSTKYLPILFEGDQQLGFYFGQKIAKLLGTEESKEFAENALNKIFLIEEDKRNLTVFAGFIFQQDNKEYKLNLFKEISINESLRKYSFAIASMIAPEMAIIEILFDLVDKGYFKINEFGTFQYGRALDHLDTEDINSIANKLIDKYKLVGTKTAISILYQYSWNEKEKWKNISNTIRNALMQKGLLNSDDDNSLDLYKWSESVINLLKGAQDASLAIHIANEIIDSCDGRHFISYLDLDIKKVCRILFELYFKEVWPLFASALLSVDQKYMVYHNLSNLFGSHIGSLGNDVGILFQNNDNLDAIFNWALQNRDLAPKRLARMAPIFASTISEGKKIGEWHPFTRRLIDEFGNDIGFLEELIANMSSYSWSGSLVPLLESKQELAGELVNHPLEKVRNWAIRLLEILKIEIERETNENVERFL